MKKIDKSLIKPFSFALLSFGGLWGVFWIGHLLNSHWPVNYVWSVATTWWTFPFTLTVGISVSIFTSSVANLFSHLRKE